MKWRIRYRTNPKYKWIEVRKGNYDNENINDRLSFIRDIFVRTDLSCVEIKIDAIPQKQATQELGSEGEQSRDRHRDEIMAEIVKP